MTIPNDEAERRGIFIGTIVQSEQEGCDPFTVDGFDSDGDPTGIKDGRRTAEYSYLCTVIGRVDGLDQPKIESVEVRLERAEAKIERARQLLRLYADSTWVTEYPLDALRVLEGQS